MRLFENNTRIPGFNTPMVFGMVMLLGSIFWTFRYRDDLRGIYLLKPTDYATALGQVSDSGVYTCGSKTTSYCFRVKYFYQVRGKTYWGDRVSYSWNGGSEAMANGVRDKYPIGSYPTVYYQKSDPAYSALEPFAPKLKVLEYGVPLGGFGLILFLVGWRFRVPRREEGFGGAWGA